MPGWKPIETLTVRNACTDYLVATADGSVRLLWWDDDDKEWIGECDQEGPIPEHSVVFWYDIQPPPVQK
jgi:hypothetical protein